MDNPGFLPYPKGFSTRAIHSGYSSEECDSMAVIPPMVLSTTFKLYTPKVAKKYEYGRGNNPSRETLEKCLASLEHAKHAICVASGMSATNNLLNILRPGDHVICGDVIYGGNYYYFTEHASNFGIEFTFVDTTKPEDFKAAVKETTKMIWIESPTNPCLSVTDIRAISKISKAHHILLVVDNSFLTPYLQRPLELGADVSVYSVTKFMNGHTDVTMGALVFNCDVLNEKLRPLQYGLGGVPSPFDCALVTRGLKTLAIRMRLHSSNSLAVAKYLETHKMIDKVLHPDLPTHPQYDLSRSQTSGNSGVVSVYIKGGAAETEKFVCGLKMFTLAPSLGGFESLSSVPALKSHRQMSPEQRQRLGITDNLVRLSVGLEDIDDLIADLKQALDF